MLAPVINVPYGAKLKEKENKQLVFARFFLKNCPIVCSRLASIIGISEGESGVGELGWHDCESVDYPSKPSKTFIAKLPEKLKSDKNEKKKIALKKKQQISFHNTLPLYSYCLLHSFHSLNIFVMRSKHQKIPHLLTDLN